MPKGAAGVCGEPGLGGGICPRLRWNPEPSANGRHVLSRDVTRCGMSPLNDLSSVVGSNSWAHFPLNVLTPKTRTEKNIV